MEQVEQLETGWQVRQKSIEIAKNGIGAATCRYRFEQARRELRQALPGFAGLNCRVASEMPVSDCGNDPCRFAVAHAVQRAQSFGVVFGTGEDQTAAFDRQRIFRFKQCAVGSLDKIAMASEARFELGQTAETAQSGQNGTCPTVFRHDMRLLVGDHLDAMFDIAQKPVAARKTFGDGMVDPSRIRKGRQRPNRLPNAQCRRTTTGDELLGLDEELRLADATAPQLHVVAGHRLLQKVPVALQLTLDGMDVRDSCVVKILAPDERLQICKEAGAEGDISRNRTGLDQRRALPILASSFVVDKRGVDGNGKRHGAGVRAQPQIRAENITVRGAVLQNTGHRLRHTDEQGQGLVPVRHPGRIRVDQHDQIDVAGIVQFARTVLSHRQNGDPRSGESFALLRREQFFTVGGVVDEKAHGFAQRGIGVAGQPHLHLIARPPTAQICQRHEQVHALFAYPKGARQVGFG